MNTVQWDILGGVLLLFIVAFLAEYFAGISSTAILCGCILYEIYSGRRAKEIEGE